MRGVGNPYPTGGQRDTASEKADIKAERIPEAWQRKPTKLRQKDRDARPPAVC